MDQMSLQHAQPLSVAEGSIDFRLVLDELTDPVILLDRAASIRYINQKATDLLHLSVQPQARTHASFLSLFAPSDQTLLTDWVDRLFTQENGQVPLETQLNESGHLAPVRLVGQRLTRHPDLVQVVLLDSCLPTGDRFDLIHKAFYDPLTQLPNRHLLVDRLKHALIDARRRREKMAVLLIDLDHFKRINDTLGHQRGDEVLQLISNTLMGLLRETDSLARYGGDEFILFTRHINSEQEAVAIAIRILQAVNRPLRINGLEEQVTASIGVSLFPKDGKEVEALIHKADLALYRAKEQGRNRYSFYDRELDHRVRSETVFANRMRRAIEDKEFALFYQPIIAAQTGQMIAFEALLRWHSPEEGLKTAGDFLPLADAVGFDRELTDWALKKAFNQMNLWAEKRLIIPGSSPLISLNLSTNQLASPYFVRQMRELIEAHPRIQHNLALEIREVDFRADNQAVRKTLSEMQQMPVQIYMDHFCDGLCHLIEASQDSYTAIKLKQSVIRLLTEQAYGEHLLSLLIKLAHNAGKQVIAEGVESEATQQHLTQLGCDALQGFWLSRPLPATQMELLLALQKSPPAS